MSKGKSHVLQVYLFKMFVTDPSSRHN